MNKQQWAYARVYASVSPGSKANKLDKPDRQSPVELQEKQAREV